MKLCHPLFYLLLIVSIAGCAHSSVIRQANYDFKKIQRVALMKFPDFPGVPGSGEVVTSLFEQSLLTAGYQIVERRHIESVLKESYLGSTGAIDSSNALEIGKLLNANALILGSITTYTPEKRGVNWVDIVDEKQTPITHIESQQELRPYTIQSSTSNPPQHAERWVTVEKQVVIGYTKDRKVSKAPQYYSLEAEVGFAARMVDAQTGEILWVASSSEEGLNIQVATQLLSNRLVKSIIKVQKKALARLNH